MSLDAIVWLVAGVGLGVGLSLILLMAYAGLERLRLGRRLKRARVLKTVPPPREEGIPMPVEPAETAAEVRPEAIEGARPAASATAARVVPLARDKDKAEPVATTETRPDSVPSARRERTLRTAPVATVPRPAAEVKPAPVAVVARSAPDAATVPASPAPKGEPKSVEALFAEAFARDRLVVPGDGGGSS